ncbi:hypothetical protein BU24DRAFT_462940 [Aaosphaeria arxii CBS 175.79]|uniref:Uncharacterized protein n=1 Tax=Aaosphaeria arxii CBS 175.79 TaxID=1450172 RepID=A0A6A5XP44_9PLEO|nr:uncharacterized protein BU24DRAFT_462940 [Aaosphaeria arxii CBS 175.79]KAF2014124.1 hypothetical protein BU24DRAFT_462940 [Aaosphaeria arxii CBS 175.79]
MGPREPSRPQSIIVVSNTPIPNVENNPKSKDVDVSTRKISLSRPETDFFPQKRQRTRTFGPGAIRRIGWWWEAGAIALGTICTILTVAVLFTIDGKSMRTWALPIQPNSLVSVFSVVTKSALLVPIAESIGQLKWSYFSRPRCLEHIEIFDEASRGPWGACVFLWKTRGTRSLAAVGAIITILLLGFEPFTQQVIEVHSKNTALFNATGYVTRTDSYTKAALVDEKLPYDLQLALTTGILGSVAGQPSQMPNTTFCPTLECRIPDFVTLGICATCESEDIVLDKNFPNCKYTYQDSRQVPFNQTNGKVVNVTETNSTDFSTYLDFKSYIDEHGGEIGPSDLGGARTWERTCSFEYPDFPSFNITFTRSDQPSDEVEDSLNLQFGQGFTVTPSQIKFGDDIIGWTRDGPFTNVAGGFFQGDSSAEGRVSACAKTSGSTRDFHFNSISGYSCFTSTSDIRRMGELPKFGETTGTITRCRPSLCAKRYQNTTVTPTGASADLTTEHALTLLRGTNNTRNGGLRNGSWIATADGIDTSNTTFHITDETLDSLAVHLDRVTSSQDFYFFLRGFSSRTAGNWTALFTRAAAVLSGAVVNPSNPSVSTVRGDAFGAEIFVRVRWEWLALPLATFVASAVFLALTVVKSGRRGTPYLFKNSVLAHLWCGLDGWEEREYLEGLTAEREKRVTYHDVQVRARGMRAQFARDANGHMKFRKVE